MNDYSNLKMRAEAANVEALDNISRGYEEPINRYAREIFHYVANPTVVLALLAELDGYQQGAKAEADAGDEAREEVRRLKEENEILRIFSNEMLGCVFEGGALDGGDIAIIGARCGVLTVRDVEEPCGEVCACAEYGFPGECYRKTDVMKGAPDHG